MSGSHEHEGYIPVPVGLIICWIEIKTSKWIIEDKDKDDEEINKKDNSLL